MNKVLVLALAMICGSQSVLAKYYPHGVCVNGKLFYAMVPPRKPFNFNGGRVQLYKGMWYPLTHSTRVEPAHVCNKKS